MNCSPHRLPQSCCVRKSNRSPEDLVCIRFDNFLLFWVFVFLVKIIAHIVHFNCGWSVKWRQRAWSVHCALSVIIANSMFSVSIPKQVHRHCQLMKCSQSKSCSIISFFYRQLLKENRTKQKNETELQQKDSHFRPSVVCGAGERLRRHILHKLHVLLPARTPWRKHSPPF